VDLAAIIGNVALVDFWADWFFDNVSVPLYAGDSNFGGTIQRARLIPKAYLGFLHCQKVFYNVSVPLYDKSSKKRINFPLVPVE
jgi:hypothetical protein